MFAPLLCIVDHEGYRETLRELARAYHCDLIADRGMDVEAQVLQAIRHLLSEATRPMIPLKDITTTFTECYGREYERQITNKWIGGIIRRKLHLHTYKSDGIYVLPLSERPKLDVLFERYGITRDEISDERNSSGQLELVFEPGAQRS
jgi:hypothetical protein